MIDASKEKQKSYIPEIIVSLGYILLFCLVPITFLSLYFYTTPQDLEKSNNIFAIDLPAFTSPQLPSGYVLGENNLFTEEFVDNKNHWRDNHEPSAFEIKDGRLYVNSKKDNFYTLATCASMSCNRRNTPFYLQAELSTQELYTKTYGVIFKMNYARDNFMLFAIDSDSEEYYLYGNAPSGWTIKLAGFTDKIKPYPSANILGVYVNKTYIELYINDEYIDSYQDTGTSFQSGQFGLFIDFGGVLIVDNLIMDKVEDK